jgi:hypothetical protein
MATVSIAAAASMMVIMVSLLIPPRDSLVATAVSVESKLPFLALSDNPTYQHMIYATFWGMSGPGAELRRAALNRKGPAASAPAPFVQPRRVSWSVMTRGGIARGLNHAIKQGTRAG